MVDYLGDFADGRLHGWRAERVFEATIPTSFARRSRAIAFEQEPPVKHHQLRPTMDGESPPGVWSTPPNPPSRALTCQLRLREPQLDDPADLVGDPESPGNDRRPPTPNVGADPR